MSPSPDRVKQTLRRLQDVARLPGPEGDVRPVGSRRLPPELARTDAQFLVYGPQQEEGVEGAAAVVSADVRFEHLAKVTDELWTFVMYAWAQPGVDHVTGFMDRHAREPMDRTCYFPVEHLTVTQEIALTGVRLLPVADPRVPRSREWFRLEKPVGAVAAVPVTGTNYSRMADRARSTAEHALRVLRIALSQQGRFGDDQLRFQLAISYAFDDRCAGWRHHRDVAYELTLQQSLVALTGAPSVCR
jgi:hypothetical protein